MSKRTASPETRGRDAKRNAEWRAENKERLKAYSQEYYKKNKGKIVEQQREYAKEHPRNNWMGSRGGAASPEEKREIRKAYRRRIRKELLDRLGGKCERCGNEDWRVLQVDHINGDGAKDRANGYNLSRLKKDVLEYGRLKYQVLCANCHALRLYEDE